MSEAFCAISDPENYRKLCKPVDYATAEKSLNAFFGEFRELRCKYGIADVYVIVKMFTITDDGVGEIVTSAHCGDEMCREPMTAWAFGHEQASRQQRIAKILHSSPAIRKT